MANNSGNYPTLQGLIIEVLFRLPVKSLLRFRCVSKGWCTLIGNSHFITKNFNRPNNNARLIICHYTHSTNSYTHTFYDEMLAPVSHNFDEPEIPTDISIFGPLNGIIFLADSNEGVMFLWNPATRSIRPLPQAHSIVAPYLSNNASVYGFGLDIVTNNYKAVTITSYWNSRTDVPYMPKVVAVYSTNTDSWRVFEAHLTPARFIHNSLCNTNMNGACYWKTTHNSHNYLILAFDLSAEIFQELPAPPDIPESKDGYLAMYNDFIAMLILDSERVEKYCEVWVMKEESFWTKQLTIGPLVDVFRPLGISENDELFLETDNSHLILYKNNSNEVTDIGTYGEYNCLKVIFYKESLVSVQLVKECQEGDG